MEGKALVKADLHLGWQISGCNTQNNSKRCRAAAPGQARGLLTESLVFLVLPSVLSPDRFEGSGKRAFYTVQGVLNVKSLASTLALFHISCAEMVNAWDNANFWCTQFVA